MPEGPSSPMAQDAEYTELETDFFRILVGRRWIPNEDNGEGRYLFEDPDADMECVISVMWVDYPAERRVEVAEKLGEFCRGGLEQAQPNQEMIYDGPHVGATAFGAQVELLATNSSTLRARYSGFVTHRFHLSIYVGGGEAQAAEIDAAFEEIAYSLQFSDLAYDDSNLPPPTALH